MRSWLLSAGCVAFCGVAQAQNPSFWPSNGPAPSSATAPTKEPNVLPLKTYTPQMLVAPSPMHNAKPQTDATQTQNSLTPQATLADPNFKLPMAENLAKWDVYSLRTQKNFERWEITNGKTVLRDFGKDQAAAEDYIKAMRDMRPTQWGRLGTDRVVVEYGLFNDEAQKPSFSPKVSVDIDAAALRVESVRGVWVLRDDQNILLNFGNSRDDAEMTYAVIRKYGFNRLGQVGTTSGGLTYLFAQDAGSKGKALAMHNQVSALQAAYQESALNRTGIDAGKNLNVGERIVIDSKALEIRREKGDYVLACGTDILANFGASEWSARDGLKLVQEQRFTEYCKFNKDVCFFLCNGNAPTKVPFSVQSTRFDTGLLKVRKGVGDKYAVYEGSGRQLFACDTEKEAEQLMQVLQHYGFDQKCQLGLSGSSALKFLAKTGR
jgi:hypothetical protein